MLAIVLRHHAIRADPRETLVVAVDVALPNGPQRREFHDLRESSADPERQQSLEPRVGVAPSISSPSRSPNFQNVWPPDSQVDNETAAIPDTW